MDGIIRFVGPAHATSRSQTLFFIPRAQLMLCPVDSDASLVKPYFSYQPSSSYHLVNSHASVLRAYDPYFSYHFFERMPHPIDSGSFSCKYPLGPQILFFIPTFRVHTTSHWPSSHKPYFSYQLFEFILHPIDPGLFPCKNQLNPNHPVHRTFLIWSHFIHWIRFIKLCSLNSIHTTLIEFHSCKPVELPSSRSILLKLFHPAFWIMYCLCHLIR